MPRIPEMFDLRIDWWAALLGPIAFAIFGYRAVRRWVAGGH
jgi:hypothetical protein